MEPVYSIVIHDGERSRRITLAHGDILDLGQGPPVDLLVTSAFPDDYVPTRTSLIGALHRAGLSVARLAADKDVDLRANSGFWLSREIDSEHEWHGARRLAVFESHEVGAPPEAVGALFRGLFPFLSDERDQTVAMPILSSGDQGWSKVHMLDSLLEASIQWMERGLPISELRIVERDADQIADLAARMRARDPGAAGQAGPASPDPGPAGVPSSSSVEAATNDIFLSFSSLNADAADALKQALYRESPQTTVFDFRLSIQKGKSYQDEIDRAIAGCRRIVSLLSPAYFASPECQEELNISRLRNKRAGFGLLIPVYWKSVTPDLPLWLQTLNRCDCVEEQFTALDDAARDIHRAL